MSHAALDTYKQTPRGSSITYVDLQTGRVVIGFASGAKTAQLAGSDSQIEVRLGSQDLGARMQIALQALDTYKQTPRGSSITYVDLQTGRVVIGFGSGAKTATDSTSSNAGQQPADSSLNQTSA